MKPRIPSLKGWLPHLDDQEHAVQYHQALDAELQYQSILGSGELAELWVCAARRGGQCDQGISGQKRPHQSEELKSLIRERRRASGDHRRELNKKIRKMARRELRA